MTANGVEVGCDIATLHVVALHAPVAMLIHEADGRILFANDRVQQLYGMAERDLQNAYVGSLILCDAPNRHCQRDGEHPQQHNSPAPGDVTPLYGLHKNGDRFPIAVHRTPITLDGGACAVAWIIDLRERRRVISSIVSTFDSREQRLMAELHDGLGQELMAISWLLQANAKRPPATRQAFIIELDNLAKLMREATGTLRDLTVQSTRVGLQRQELVDSLRRFARNLRNIAGVDVRVKSRGVGGHSFGNTDASHLYRIAQEACSNVLKHAEATRVGLELIVTRGRVRLSIIDNGIGIGSRRDTGLGLRTMEYRAAALGGVLLVESAPSVGTRVSCVYPR